MRRTKESQKAQLLKEFNSSGHNKKVIATRGSHALLDSYKNKQRKNFSVPIFPLLGFWTVLSLFFCLIFFHSFSIFIEISFIGFIFIYIVKKLFIKEGKYQIIETFDKKKNLSETILEFNYLFNTQINEELKSINDTVEYLEKFFNQNLLSIEQEHYIQSCKEKHLLDLFKTLESSHKEHLLKNQEKVLEQIKAINIKLKKIVYELQQLIELKINVKSVFSKDNV